MKRCWCARPRTNATWCADMACCSPPVAPTKPPPACARAACGCCSRAVSTSSCAWPSSSRPSSHAEAPTGRTWRDMPSGGCGATPRPRSTWKRPRPCTANAATPSRRACQRCDGLRCWPASAAPPRRARWLPGSSRPAPTTSRPASTSTCASCGSRSRRAPAAAWRSSWRSCWMRSSRRVSPSTGPRWCLHRA